MEMLVLLHCLQIVCTKLFCADCIVENSRKQPIFIWTQSPTNSRGISRFAALQVKKSGWSTPGLDPVRVEKLLGK